MPPVLCTIYDDETRRYIEAFVWRSASFTGPSAQVSLIEDPDGILSKQISRRWARFLDNAPVRER